MVRAISHTESKKKRYLGTVEEFGRLTTEATAVSERYKTSQKNQKETRQTRESRKVGLVIKHNDRPHPLGKEKKDPIGGFCVRMQMPKTGGQTRSTLDEHRHP